MFCDGNCEQEEDDVGPSLRDDIQSSDVPRLPLWLGSYSTFSALGSTVVFAPGPGDVLTFCEVVNR